LEARGLRLLVALLALVCACAAVLALDAGGSPRRRAASAAFQEQVGGLGFGPALDLSGCACGFDPRLDDSCSAAVGPVPGGACFCPRHGGLTPWPERTEGARSSTGDGDATPPRR
jgi:hypothetical protein